MKKPIQIGITGGIGTGKSIVCKIFKVLKVPTYDADSRAKAVMTTDGILVEAIRKEFGTLSYKANGDLNREFLSKEVFADEAKLKTLNALVHPRVAADYDAWLSKQIGQPYVLKEAALLFESGSYMAMDKVLVVSSPIDFRIQRILSRDAHRNEGQVRSIMSNQLAEEEKERRADYRIKNDEKHSVLEQALQLHQQFLILSA